VSYRQLLSRSDARRYLAGQSLSLLGDGSMWLVCALWVKTLTGSNGAAGLTFFFFLAPALAAPLIGLLVDRVRRRTLLVAANVAGAVLLIPLLAVRGAGDVWLVYLVMLMYGAANLAIAAGQSALLHRMLPADLLADANGVLRTTQESLRVLAPLVGAGLFAAFGARAVVLLDVVTFLAAAAFTWSLRLREPAPPPAPARSHVVAEVSAGLRFVVHSAVLRRVTAAAVVCTLVLGFTESTSWAVISLGLHRPPTFVGVTQLCQGLGAIAAGLVTAALVRRLGEVRVVALGLALCAAGQGVVATPWLPVVLAGKALFGAGLPLLIIAMLTLLQRAAPDRLQGRVYTAFEIVTTVPQTVSVAVGAWLVTVLDYRLVLAATAVACLAGALLVLRARRPAAALDTEPTEPAAAAVPAGIAPAGTVDTTP
jgi:MFS family permease